MIDETAVKKPRLRIGLWPAVAVVLLVVAFIVYSEMGTSKAAIGKPAPNFTLNDVAGKPVSLSDLRGDIVMVNFWASWCGPCREETPALQTFASRYGDKVTLLGVNYQEPVDKITAFIKEFDMTYRVLRDTDGKVADRYKMKALPESWFIDETGVARIYWIGTMTFEDMRDSYRSTTGMSIDGERLPGETKTSYRISTHNGFYLHDVDTTWQSTDAGKSWLPTKTAVAPNLVGKIGSVAWAGSTAVAWVEGKGLFLTVNNGRTWSALAQKTFPVELPNVALTISTDGQQIYAAGLQGLYVSKDRGKTWKQLSFDQLAYGLAIHPTQPGRLLVATAKGIWGIGMDGNKAALLAASPARRFDDVAVLYNGGNEQIVAVAPNGDMYRTDGAGEWTVLNP